jgi:DNA-binding transcriptional MocR family regulator
MTTHSPQRRPRLYEDLADQITDLVARGTFQTGDRLPSVRELSRQRRVSLSTVMEAYRLLEDRGVAEVRPQSGHYVRVGSVRPGEEPDVFEPSVVPTEVTIGDVALRVMSSLRDASLVPLGAAVPHPDLIPLQALNRALVRVTRREGAASCAYEVPPGSEALRIQIARGLLSHGCTVSPNQVVITTGCQEAIMLSLRAVCRPGDAVAIESPTYFNFLQAIHMLGLRAVEIPTHPLTGMQLEALRAAIEEQPVRACLLTCNFSNPLGSCMPEEKKRALVEMLAERDIPLIEDDLYGDLAFSGPRPWAARAYDRTGSVLLCSSYSKTIAPGYRVGWVVAGRYQREIERQKIVENIASATLPQLTIAEFLATGGYDRHLRRIRRAYARQTTLLAQAVDRYFPPGTRMTRPAGGFVLWVQCPEYVDALQLYAQALEAGISIAPGPIFSAHPAYSRCIRLNAAQWSPRIEAAVERVGRLAGRMAR